MPKKPIPTKGKPAAKQKTSGGRRPSACSPLARKMLAAAKSRKDDDYGAAAGRVIAVADEGMNLYEIAQWNNVVDVLRELVKFTENSKDTPLKSASSDCSKI